MYLYLLCQNQVEDFSRWHAIFTRNTAAALDAGLHLQNVWRDVQDPQSVHFLFRVESMERALAFMATPDAAESGQLAGVIDGRYAFVDSIE